MEQPIKLTIEMLPGGRLNVSGPIENKILCFGLLETAKDIIRDHVAKEASKIVVPKLSVPFPSNGN